jgi:hypothetical protein
MYDTGRRIGRRVRGSKGGGVGGVVGSVDTSSSMGEVGTEGPGKGERFESWRSEDVGREGALVGRKPGDGSGGSRDVERMGSWVLIGGVGA